MMVTRISLIFGMSYMTFTIVGKFKPKAVSPPPPGGTRHMKGAGMLVVSLTGVNFGNRVFWAKRHHI